MKLENHILEAFNMCIIVEFYGVAIYICHFTCMRMIIYFVVMYS